MRLPMNIVSFAKTDDSLKAYKQFKDYYNHKLNKVGQFDASITLEEKKEKLDFATKAEIARLSGVYLLYFTSSLGMEKRKNPQNRSIL